MTDTTPTPEQPVEPAPTPPPSDSPSVVADVRSALDQIKAAVASIEQVISDL